MRILVVLCIISSVNIVTQFILGRLGITNYILSNTFVPIEFLLLVGIYFYSCFSQRSKKILVSGAVFFIVIWLVNKFLLENSSQMNSPMAMISRVFLVSLSLMVIYDAMKDEAKRLIDRSVFWVATGVVLYSSGTFIVFGVSNELLKSNASHFVVAWHINWSLLIITNLLYTKALLCKSPA